MIMQTETAVSSSHKLNNAPPLNYYDVGFPFQCGNNGEADHRRLQRVIFMSSVPNQALR